MSTISSIVEIETISSSMISSMTNIQSMPTSVFSIETLLTGTIVDPSGNVPFSINDLINSQDVIINKENADKESSLSFINTSIDSLKPVLYTWASKGYPQVYGVSSLTLQPPAVCSDGLTRNLMEYFTWLTNYTVEEWLASMDAKVSGMAFSYSHNGNNYINLHITKTAGNLFT